MSPLNDSPNRDLLPLLLIDQERLKAACKPTVHEMMFFMNAWALAILSAAAYFSGQGVEGYAFCSSNPYVMVRNCLDWPPNVTVVVVYAGFFKYANMLDGVGKWPSWVLGLGSAYALPGRLS